MNTYADYEYYKNVYKGQMAKAEFTRLSIVATTKIKANTFNRIDENNVPDEVKMCTCVLADKLLNYESTQGISAESVGSWSVSYESSSTQTVDNMCISVMKDFLSELYTEDGIPLLYRGC